MRVLVVDDFPDAADTSCMWLELLGHECRTAKNGKDALAEAARFEPRLVILDIGLPDMTGYELARQLRDCADGKPLHIAALTGWGQAADRVRAFAAGCDQHVVKPASGAKLQAIVDAVTSAA